MRRVMVLLELETDLPLRELRRKDFWRSLDVAYTIKQVQANMIRTPAEKKGLKKGRKLR